MRLTLSEKLFKKNGLEMGNVYANQEIINKTFHKLSQLEDIMEKYGINSPEELEHIILNDATGERSFKDYVECYVKPYKDIEEEPIKINYINSKLKNQISLDILESINIISG